MKPWQFFTTLALGCVTILLAITLILLGRTNSTWQTKLSQQQEEINRGTTSQQIGSNLLRDMGVSATQNSEMKELLKKHGFTLSTNSPSSSN